MNNSTITEVCNRINCFIKGIAQATVLCFVVGHALANDADILDTASETSDLFGNDDTVFEELPDWNTERYSCSWKFGGYGQKVSCGAKKVAFGLCGSGKNADCNGKYTGLNCCDESGITILRPSYTLGANYGVRLSCGYGAVATSLCSSGKNRDCRVNGISNTIGLTCSSVSGISINQNACFWQSSPYGRKTSCPTGFVMTGACGSGENRDCQGVHSEVKCCSYN